MRAWNDREMDQLGRVLLWGPFSRYFILFYFFELENRWIKLCILIKLNVILSLSYLSRFISLFGRRQTMKLTAWLGAKTEKDGEVVRAIETGEEEAMGTWQRLELEYGPSICGLCKARRLGDVAKRVWCGPRPTQGNTTKQKSIIMIIIFQKIKKILSFVDG